MKHRVLGRTGLRVSVLGMGTGTRFGRREAHSQAAATRLVRAALELGVNYFDTAPMYLEAEEMLGAALVGVPREDYVVATKFFPVDDSGRTIGPAELRASVERSLRRLRVDALDILQIHGCRPHWLEPVLEALGEELERLRAAGKYRFLGAGETILEDPTHAMVPAAVRTGRFDQALVGYGLLSPFAENSALPACGEAGVGVVTMVSVGRALRDAAHLRARLDAAVARGEIASDEFPGDGPLDWLLDGYSRTLPTVGVRFAASHPSVACVLAGTLDPAHLRENVEAVNAPPLPAAHLSRLRRIFLRTDPRRWVLHGL